MHGSEIFGPEFYAREALDAMGDTENVIHSREKLE